MPAYALCSLHWGAILAGYPTLKCRLQDEIAWLNHCYQQARLFFCPAPSMTMPQLDNCRPVGPIARRGQKRDLTPIFPPIGVW